MNQKIKVLFIAGRISIKNGAYHSLVANLKEFKTLDIEPIVVIHSHGKVEEGLAEIGVRYYVIPYFGCTVPADSPSKLKGCFKTCINHFLEKSIKRIIREEKIDLVHINVGTTSVGAISALELKKPLVWHLREFGEVDVNLTYIHPKKMKELLNSADKVIAISNAVSDSYRIKYKLNNLVTIYNGISFNELLPVKQFKNNKPIRIVMTGRIVPTKGQFEAVKALAFLVEKGNRNFELNIVGDVGNKKYREEIDCYVREEGIEKFVKFAPHQKDLRPIWKNAALAVICSTKEGFGRVTAEFMLNGIPVVGADTGATPELLENDRGWLYSYGNPESLAESILYVVDHPIETMKRAENAQKYAAKVFTSKYCAEQIMNVYRDVL